MSAFHSPARPVLQLEPLRLGNVGQFEDLLGGDEFGGCFCAVWTAHGADWVARCSDPARPNLEVTRRRVAAGEHVGFVVSEDDAVVAWTGSGPKTRFPLLASKLGSRLSPLSPDVWSIGCVAVRARSRGVALPEQIVRAVADLAGAAGAKAVEAYPTRPWDEPRSYRGSHRMYERLGFREIGAERDGTTEVLLVRLDL